MVNNTASKPISRLLKQIASSNFLQALQIERWFILLDVALLVTALLLIFTTAKVFFFHVIFVLLTFGAFFWKFHAFALRAIFWVTVTTIVVTHTIFVGKTQVEEIIEIPLLTSILILVFAIAGQRSKAKESLRKTNAELENRVAERTAELTRVNAELTHEITKHKLTEATLRESEERYRRLVELSFEAIAIHSEGKLVYVNPPGVKLLGAAKARELIGKPIFEIVHPDYWGIVQTRVQQLEGGRSVPLIEEKFIRLDGTEVDVEVAAIPITYQGQPAVQTIVRDITARKRAEMEREYLLTTEREQRLLAETLGEVFLTLTAQTSREAVLDEILRQVQRIVSYSAANIMILQRGILHIARHQGYHLFSSREMMPGLRQLLEDFPLDAEVVQSRQPLVISDTHQNPHWVTTPESGWIRSFIAVPICLRDRVLGLLRLDSDLPGKFSGEDLKRLQPLANAAAIALDNARLYDEARKEIAEQTIQAEAEIIQLNQKLLALQYASATIASSAHLQHVLNTIPREMASLLKVSGCCILEWNQIANTVSIMAKYGFNDYWEGEAPTKTFPLADYPLMDRALTEHLPQQITHSHRGNYGGELAYMRAVNLKTLLMVRMEFQNRSIGLVHIMDEQAERIFTNREIGLIQLLANQVASAIESSRLYEQLRQEINERVQVEKELRQVAAKNQAILNAISDSMFYLSREGKVLDYKVISQNNFPPELLNEINVGKYLDDILTPNLVNLTLHYINKALDTNTMQVFEGELLLSGDVRYFEARLVVSGQDEVLAIIRDITEHKKYEATLEKERVRIARDLHDSLGQSLGYLHLKLDELTHKNTLQKTVGIRQEVTRMRDVANEAYELVRNMLAAARPANSADLATALLAQAKLAGNRARFRVQLTSEGQPRPLSPIAQHQVLYIFQEALSNVVRHANAQEVNLKLLWTEEMLTIMLSDDGCGFETNVPRSDDHFGLTIMQERAEEINGFLSITSEPNNGTMLTLRLPLASVFEPLTEKVIP